MQRKITLKYKDNTIDIKVDEQQRIKTTFEVLEETKPRYFQGITNADNVRLGKNGRILDIALSYNELGIFDGSILNVE